MIFWFQCFLLDIVSKFFLESLKMYEVYECYDYQEENSYDCEQVKQSGDLEYWLKLFKNRRE